MFGDILTLFATVVRADGPLGSAEAAAVSGWELTPTSISSIVAVVASILAVGWGFIKNIQDKKKGTIELAKNGYEQLAIENTRLIHDLKALRKTADKFWILRELAIQTEAGRAMVVKTEKLADEVDSAEN